MKTKPSKQQQVTTRIGYFSLYNNNFKESNTVCVIYQSRYK